MITSSRYFVKEVIMDIIVAKSAGFCYGVKRAIDMAESALKEKHHVYCLGEIVHNKFVIDDLKSKGLKIVKNIDEVPNNKDIILRAHGVTQCEILVCRQNRLNTIDTTCPNVEKIHKIVKEYSENGYEIIIVGDKAHPEVVGTAGWCKNTPTIINTIEEIKYIDTSKKYCLVSQTTTNSIKNNGIIEEIKKYIADIKIFNTVCMATETRQKEALELAQMCDYMIIIGDKMSSNSNKLYEISRKICKNTQFIENIDELILNFDKKSCKIGITAGASTPEKIIKEVVSKVASKQ
jgi:4-hydroxy-3-methylbut-2-enyl diphosphate reductase